MGKKFRIALIRETKAPFDSRVALTPAQCAELMKRFPNIEVVVQPSDIRCFKDSEYEKLGIPARENLSDCHLLIGIKEVDAESLVKNNTYLFFAHISKKQPQNRAMLQEIARKKVTLIDFEHITNVTGERIIAFGHWAGIIGSYNALRAHGLKTRSYKLRPAHQCANYKELLSELKKVQLPPVKILITGGGRTATGALELFHHMGIKEITPELFLTKENNEPVLCQIDSWNYAKRIDNEAFDQNYWIDYPSNHVSTFLPYTKQTDILVACHYWDYRSPHFFTKDDMRSSDFRISVIADISCDVPGPIPSTLRTSTTDEPFYDYNPFSEKEEKAFSDEKNITVMAIDNLPNALPYVASEFFGNIMVDKVIPNFITGDPSRIIMRATIVNQGKLTMLFSYLLDYLNNR